MKKMANTITIIRILLSITLLAFPAFSPGFYTLYLAAGISDMADGMIARKTHTESLTGAKLDSFADLIFTLVVIIKLFPSLILPNYLWIWIVIIAAVKLFNIIFNVAIHKQFPSVHSIANKLTGLLLFLFPLSMVLGEINTVATIICIVATFAAVEEGYIIRTARRVI